MSEQPKSGVIETAVSVVPTLFYDLIARVIPGTAFCVALTWKSYFGEGSKIGAMSATSLTLLVGAGYLTGMFLTCISWLVCEIPLWPLANRVASCLTGVKDLSGPKQIGIDMDKIALRDRVFGNELFKHLAEAVACENTFSGFLLLWIACMWSDGTWPESSVLSGLQRGNVLLPAIALLMVFTIAFRQGAVSVRTKKLLELTPLDRDPARLETRGPVAERKTGIS
jgi:hypothetical protein